MSDPYKLFHINEKDNTYTALSVLAAEDIVAMARRILGYRFRRGACLTSPQVTKDFLTLELSPLDQEVFCCLFLDNRHRIITFEKMFFGTLDGASVHPREVVKQALAHNAAAIIFAHNHPSGVTEPSRADVQLTRRLTDALALVDVRVLDHMVVGEGEPVSFAERGLI